MFKVVSTILLSLGLSFGSHAESNPSTCGVGTDGKIEPFSFEICESDESIAALYNLLPNLTEGIVELLNLDNSSAIIEANENLHQEQAGTKVERASRVITWMSYLLGGCLMTFATWNLATSHLKKKQGRGFSVDYASTGASFTLGLFLLMPFQGFFVYQWIVLAAAIAGIAVFNFFSSTLLYYYAELISPQDLPLWASKADYAADARALSLSDINSSLCTTQVATNDYAVNKMGVWKLSTTLNDMGWSYAEDGRDTPMEVFDNKRVGELRKGVGVGVRDVSWIDGLWESYLRIKPEVCSSEKSLINGGGNRDSEDFQEIVSLMLSADDNFSNIGDLYNAWLQKKQSVDSEGNANLNFANSESFLEDIKNFFSIAFLSYRDPSIGRFRAETEFKSFQVAEKIRAFNCLSNFTENQREGNATMANLANRDFSGSDKLNMACLSILEFDEMRGLIGIVPPAAFLLGRNFHRDKIIQLKRNTSKEIRALEKELTERHEIVLANIFSAYEESKQRVNLEPISGQLTEARQKGFIYFFGQFIKFTTLAETFVRSGDAYKSFIPVLGDSIFDDYYFPPTSSERGDIFVGQLVTPAMSGSKTQSQSLSANALVNTAKSIAAVNKNGNMNAEKVSEGIKDVLIGLDSSVGELTTMFNFGVTADSMEGTDFYTRKIEQGIGRESMSTEFLMSCFSGDTEGFSVSMIQSCSSLFAHPYTILRNFGALTLTIGIKFLLVSMGASAIDSSLKALGDSMEGVNDGKSGEVREKGRSASSDKAKRMSDSILKLKGYIEMLSSLFLTIALGLIALGLLFTVILPILPLMIAMLMSVGWFLVVSVGVLFGSMFIPFMFKIKKSGGDPTDVFNGTLSKMVYQISLKPIVIGISLVMIWILLDLAYKTSMFFVSMIYANSGVDTMGSVMAAIMTVGYTVAVAYIYCRTYVVMSSKSTEIVGSIMKFVEFGAQVGYARTEQAASTVAQAGFAFMTGKRVKGASSAALNQTMSGAGTTFKGGAGAAKKVAKKAAEAAERRAEARAKAMSNSTDELFDDEGVSRSELEERLRTEARERSEKKSTNDGSKFEDDFEGSDLTK